MLPNRASRIIALSLLLTAINSYSLLAQSGTSSAISGTVLDVSGAALPDAAITATEVDTKAARTVQDQLKTGVFSSRRSIPAPIPFPCAPQDLRNRSRSPLPSKSAAPPR